MTRLLTTTAIALTLVAGSVAAESHTNGEQMEQNLENAGDSMEKAGENAAEATENAAENAADSTGEAMDNAADATADAAGDAAEATENAAEATADAAGDAAQATENAATDVANATDDAMANDTNMIRARDILGGTIYSANAAEGVAEFKTVTYESVGDDWDNIGEIEDIVLSSDGKLQGVVAEVGGFLGMGDKHVFVPMDSVKLVPVEDASMALVVGYSEEQLKELKDVDEAFWN